MLFLAPPELQWPRLCPMELVHSPWRIPCISMGAGVLILTMNALSTILDEIAPCISPKLSESLAYHLSCRSGGLCGRLPLARVKICAAPLASTGFRWHDHRETAMRPLGRKACDGSGHGKV